jgi:hypothetical protein
VVTYRAENDREASGGARLSFLLGALGILLAPAAIVLSDYSERVTLVMSVAAVAVSSTGFGLVALSLARKARLRREISLGRAGGRRAAALGRTLGTLALAIGLTACVALAVDGFLLVMSR